MRDLKNPILLASAAMNMLLAGGVFYYYNSYQKVNKENGQLKTETQDQKNQLIMKDKALAEAKNITQQQAQKLKDSDTHNLSLAAELSKLQQEAKAQGNQSALFVAPPRHHPLEQSLDLPRRKDSLPDLVEDIPQSNETPLLIFNS